MKTYDVEVCRIGFGFMTFPIRASSRKEAKDRALDMAGNHVFSERSSEYIINDDKDVIIADHYESNYIDWMKKVLKQKQVLPLLMGLNPDLDRIIEKRLR